jgi:MFS transporter, FHS family, glucose/mannose:H+ symporter
MPQPSRVKFLKIVLHIIFFLSGIAAVLIGQVLPILARHFALTDLQVGYFFPSQFAGSLFGTFITSRLARRNNYMAASIFGAVAMAVGVLLLNVDSFQICVAGFFINGMGIGLTLPAINMMIIEVNPLRTGPALSILNLCWGIGAIICKPFVDMFSNVDDVGLTTFILAVPLLSAAILLKLAVQKTADNVPNADADGTEDDAPIWRMPIAWAIAFFNFVHVGFESGMGGWLTTYTDRVEGEPVIHWLSPTLLYFLFFVLGRGVAPFLFRYFNENQMLFLGLAIMLGGITLTLLADTVITLGVGAAVAGFGTSWIFPTNVSRFSKTFGPRANRRATPLFAAGTLGAAAVTWLIGYLSDKTGDLRSGMFVLGFSVVLLIFLQIALAVRGQTKSN